MGKFKVGLMSKFKVGDYVIGNEKAIDYMITSKGVVCVVVEDHVNNYTFEKKLDIITIKPIIEGDEFGPFTVDESAFDHYLRSLTPLWKALNGS